MENLLKDVQILRESINRDLAKSSWIGYERYQKEFNRILIELQKKELCNDMEVIDSVPEENKAYMGMGVTREEIEKFKDYSPL